MALYLRCVQTFVTLQYNISERILSLLNIIVITITIICQLITK